MGVMLSALFSASWFEYVRVVDLSKEQMSERSKITAKFFGDLCITYMLFVDKEGAVDELEKLKNFKDVLYGAIYDKYGRLFASYKEVDFEIEVPNRIHNVKDEIIKKQDFWIAQIPVVKNGDLIAYMQIAYSIDKLQQIKEEFFYSLINFVLVISIGAFLLTYKLQEHISKPIVKLKESMDDIAKNGKYGIKLKKYSNDELGSLYEGYNTMMQQLSNREKELIELNESLEQRVQIRTQELQESLDTLKETQNQMIEAEKMAALGGLVAGVAHEINTPIGLGVMGITHLKDMTGDLKELYEKENMSQGDFEKYLQQSGELNQSIYINLKRAAELVKSFKKVAVDQSMEGMHTFIIRDRIDQILISLGNRLKKSRVKIEVDCEEYLQIYSDPGSIVQIFTNLITNSLMHGFDRNDEGLISIKVYEEDGYIFINYKDNGKGIKREVLPKIFNPFFTTNREAGGTGLGLHIIYNIITSQLGGTISVSSTEGEGVEFEIVLKKEKDA